MAKQSGVEQLRKIERLAGTGLFTDYKAQGPVDFKRFNIVYSENGMGKSTLAAVLRSARHNDPQLIMERKSLHASNAQEATLRLQAGGAVQFTNGKWNEPLNHLEIFDNTFVDRNVFRGNTLEPDNKRNLFFVIVGETGTKKAQDLQQVINDLVKAKEAEKAPKEALNAFTGGLMTPAKYNDLVPGADVETRLTKEKKTLETARKAVELGKTPKLALLDVPAYPAKEALAEFFSSSLAHVDKTTIKEAVQHLAAHQHDGFQAWIEQGFAFEQDKACPFCGQSLDNVSLVGSLSELLGETYQQHKKVVQEKADEFQEGLTDDYLWKVNETLNANALVLKTWEQHVAVNSPTFKVDQLKKLHSEASSSLMKPIARKAQSPAEALNAGKTIEQAYAKFDQARALVIDYNKTVKEYNTAIDKTVAAAATTLPQQVEARVRMLEVEQKRSRPQVQDACKAWKLATAEFATLNVKKDKLYEEIRDLAQKFAKTYLEQVNAFLDKCGAGFCLTEITPNFVSQTPNTSPRFAVQGTVISTDVIPGTPCFANTLSEGDKRTLAFAYFLAKLKGDPEVASKIVIFDDPMCSLDANRRSRTKEAIFAVASKALQVIVLTHDLHFAHDLWEGTSDKSALSTVTIERDGASSQIKPWNVEQAVQSGYFKNYFKIADYLESSTGHDKRDVARCIRPLLDASLRLRFPKSVARGQMLGHTLAAIGKAAKGHPLHALTPIITDLQDINNWAKKYHHEDNPNADTENITDAELVGYVKQTLKTMSAMASEHA